MPARNGSLLCWAIPADSEDLTGLLYKKSSRPRRYSLLCPEMTARIVPAGWCSFGRQARCTRVMFRLVPNDANRLLETIETDRIVYRALSLRLTASNANRVCLLTAGSLFSGLNGGSSRCFDPGRISGYAIGLTRNPYLIQIICVTVFLEADSRAAMRLERLRRDELNEG